jgi:hypothetical protein
LNSAVLVSESLAFSGRLNSLLENVQVKPHVHPLSEKSPMFRLGNLQPDRRMIYKPIELRESFNQLAMLVYDSLLMWWHTPIVKQRGAHYGKYAPLLLSRPPPDAATGNPESTGRRDP